MTQKEKTKFRSSGRWKRFRKELLIEREYTCEICGIIHKKGLNIHHHNPDNYTTLRKQDFSVLCKSCHREVERLLSRTKNIVDIDNYLSNFKRVYTSSN